MVMPQSAGKESLCTLLSGRKSLLPEYYGGEILLLQMSVDHACLKVQDIHEFLMYLLNKERYAGMEHFVF